MGDFFWQQSRNMSKRWQKTKVRIAYIPWLWRDLNSVQQWQKRTWTRAMVDSRPQKEYLNRLKITAASTLIKFPKNTTRAGTVVFVTTRWPLMQCVELQRCGRSVRPTLIWEHNTLLSTALESVTHVCMKLCASQGEPANMDFFQVIRQCSRASAGACGSIPRPPTCCKLRDSSHCNTTFRSGG